MKGQYRPVSYSYVHTAVRNNACAAQNATLTVTFSNKYNYHSATPTPTSVSGNTVTWNIANLGSFGYPFWTTIQLTPGTGTITLGEVLCANAVISPTTGDVVPGNNTMSRCDSVVSSFDPNEKEVFPQGMIVPGTKLEYTLHFENLGNDTAFNIHILDTLSDNLNAATFEMTGSSHAASANIFTGTNGKKIVRFDFANIHLADASAPHFNKGYAKFSINAKTPLAPMTQIHNQAGIYFDINPVVMTNMVTNWIGLGVKEVLAEKGAAIYPNPAHDELLIKTDNKNFQSATLVNMMGQVLIEQKLEQNDARMDIRSLAPGIYFLQLNGTAGSITEKIEKQ
jgi:uncharacterized repeat protein (TIGR01451 family)